MFEIEKMETRQRGLMMALKLRTTQLGSLFTGIGFDSGLLTIYTNNDPSVVQILPPLITAILAAGIALVVNPPARRTDRKLKQVPFFN